MDELPYTEQEHKPIIINILNTESDLEDVSNPSEQINLLKGRQFETTNNKVDTIDSTSTYDQYPTLNAAREALCTSEPLYIKLLEDGYVGFALTGTVNKSFEYSLDGIHWTSTTVSTTSTTGNLISCLNGNRIYFRSSNTTTLNSGSFVVKKTNSLDGVNAAYEVGGLLASFYNFTTNGNATSLFRNTGVVNAKDLDVSYNNTAYICQSMFAGCSSLISTPILYATTLQVNAYNQMFYNCISLTQASALPAKTLINSCYYFMFENCTSLVDMPIIEATTLAMHCCRGMFRGCTALKNLQPLLAIKMSDYCYNQMFYGCTSLTQLPLLPATTLAQYCYSNMFYGCSNIKLSTTQTAPYLTLYKIPNTPVFYYDTLWDTTMVTTPDSEATVTNSLTTQWPLQPVYKLPSTTVFNGSSTYIDTGIKLNDTDKDFTLFVDFQYANKSQYMPILHALYEASPYPGTQITLSSDQTKIRMQYYGETAIADYDTNRHTAAITHVGGTQQEAIFYFDDIVQNAPKTITYSNFSQNTLLGCYQSTGGTRGRYFNGTLYDARLYFDCLSANDISRLQNGEELTDIVYSIRGTTLSGLTFSSNNNNYDSMYCDNTGNLYYGASGTNTKVYDVSTGWVSDNYKSLIVPSDKSLFEDLFVNNGSANLYNSLTVTTGYYINGSGVLTSENTCQVSAYIPVIPGHSYTWTGVSGKTGTNNKRAVGYATNDQATGTAINSVAVTGTGVDYNNTFTVPTGINYVRLSFNIADTNVILIDNDATNTGDWLTFKQQNLTIVYGWNVKGQSLTMPFTSNSTDYSVLSVDTTGNILYDTTTAYNASSGWTDNNYKTIRTTFQTSLVFVDADTWLPFYTTNKISVTGPTTITVPTGALGTMFTNTGGTFTGTPTINKAYFTDADVVPNWYDSLSPGGI